MADNVDITPGTGATIAADEISSVKHQRVKAQVAKSSADGGPDGNAFDVVARSPDWGDTSTDWLPMVNVNVMANNFALIGAAEVAAQTYAIGDVIGGVKNYTNYALVQSQCPYLDSLCVVDADGIGPDLLVLLSGNSVGTGVDGAAHSFTASGSAGIIMVPIAAADYKVLGSTAKVATVYPRCRIPDVYGDFNIAVIAKSSYTMTGDNFYLSVCVDHS